MQKCDFGRERRLIPNPRRQAAKQPGDFAAGLYEAKHIVHEQQHVLMLAVAEVLGDRECRQSDAPTRTGWLVHLTIDQHAAIEHLGAAHLGQELMAFTRPLADAREDGDALIALHHRVDELHHHDSLADACTAKHGGFAALGYWSDEVDDLDPGLEEYNRGASRREWWRGSMDRVASHIRWQRRTFIARVSGDIKQAAEDSVTHWDGYGSPRGTRLHSTRKSGGRLQRDPAYCVFAEMRLRLDDQRSQFVAFDKDSLIDLRKLAVRKKDVDHRTSDGDNHASLKGTSCSCWLALNLGYSARRDWAAARVSLGSPNMPSRRSLVREATGPVTTASGKCLTWALPAGL